MVFRTDPRANQDAIAYRGPKLPNVVADLVIPGALSLDDDERIWVPQSEGVWFRPLMFSASQGFFVNILRDRSTRRLCEDDGIIWSTIGGLRKGATPLNLREIFTPLEVPDGVKEMITLFHVTGAYIYVDPEGVPLGVEDVFSKIEAARKHYQAVGLGAEYVNRFIR